MPLAKKVTLVTLPLLSAAVALMVMFAPAEKVDALGGLVMATVGAGLPSAPEPVNSMYQVMSELVPTS